MGTMMGAMILQPLMGWVLDRHWAGTMVSGVRIYPLEGYQSAFSLMIISSILAAILICFTTETRCQQKTH
jgi:sugar phosphate permease